MKRTVPLFLAALMACALSCPALAAEEPSAGNALYPVEVTEYTQGERPRLEKTYRLTRGQDPALIPTADFEREGKVYTLLDMTWEDQTESDTMEYTESVTMDSKTKDLEQILPELAATLDVITEDGYTGTLQLDPASIQTDASGYRSTSRTVTAKRTYPSLSDADVSMIPKTIEDNGRTLTLADVQWREAEGFFHADATYSTTVSGKSATGYTVTAAYIGDVTRTTTDTVLYKATFTGSPVGAEADGAEGIGWKWLLVLPVAGGVAGLGALGVFLEKKYKAKKGWKEFTQ